MSSSRLTWVDSARGVAILLVVLGHAIQFTDEDFDSNAAFRFIYAVHMPLFMFISGMVARVAGMSTKEFLRNRARTLLLPFLAWLPLCWFAIAHIQRPEGFSAGLGQFLLDVARSPDAGGLWFLLVIF